MFAALSSCCSADCATALQVDLPPWTARSVVVLLGWVGFPLEGCRDKCLCVFLSLSLPVNSQNSSPQIPVYAFVRLLRSFTQLTPKTNFHRFFCFLSCLFGQAMPIYNNNGCQEFLSARSWRSVGPCSFVFVFRVFVWWWCGGGKCTVRELFVCL